MTSKTKRKAAELETVSPLAHILDRPTSAGSAAHAQGMLFLGELLSASPHVEVLYQQAGKQFEGTPASLVPLTDADVGSTVVLSALAEGQGLLVLGMLQPADAPAKATPSLKINDTRIEISAEEELVLRCGDASIRIDQTGAITVKGKTLLSRAEGTNRVQGGAVQIN